MTRHTTASSYEKASQREERVFILILLVWGLHPVCAQGLLLRSGVTPGRALEGTL